MSEEHEENTVVEKEHVTLDSLRQILEEWWNTHIHQSPIVKDPRGWNHLIEAFGKLKETLQERFR